MTSVHMYAQPNQSNNCFGIDNQNKDKIQSSSGYDEAERVKRRMDNLRKHHEESTEIYNRTQPIIDEQIHEDTLKYLKNNQLIGTKAKNQKQRAPKKQRTALNSNNNIINVNTNNTLVQQTNVNLTSYANGFPSDCHPTPPLSQSNHIQQQLPQPQQIALYSPHMQQPHQQHLIQQTMHVQPKLIQNNQQMQPQMQAQTQPQSQQHLNYHQNHVGIYQQLTQPTMQNNIHHQQTQHSQHVYIPQQHQSQTQSQSQSQSQSQIHGKPVELQNHHIVQPHTSRPTQQHYTHQSLNGTHHISFQQQQQRPGYVSSHTSIASVHNDFDLPIQAGLECDVDSLIKHEITVEGLLDFNHELLLKLDNHYPGYN